VADALGPSLPASLLAVDLERAPYNVLGRVGWKRPLGTRDWERKNVRRVPKTFENALRDPAGDALKSGG
jgi:hypothetical protein